MADTENEPGAFASLLSLVVIIAVGYFGYTTLFPSDRARVRSCIEGMMEASRGTGMYGEFGHKLAVVNNADTVVIEREERQQIGNNVLLTLHYSTDGRRSSMMCAG